MGHDIAVTDRRSLCRIVFATAVAGAAACGRAPATEGDAHAAAASSVTPGGARASKLLTATFAPRAVRRIEVGDFHFSPGQLAPVHTHVAPALGYVSKGAIVYQVEGQPPQILKAGDAFYEPVGPRILHFDNASQTEEAVFTDFNFEREGEPFIVFPAPLTVKIDRRTFPAVEVTRAPDVRAIDIEALTIDPGASVRRPRRPLPVMAYVADGAVEVRTRDEAHILATGESFDVPAEPAETVLANPSPSAPAKVVTFEPVL